MNEADRNSLSKFLSYVLRHKPEEVGISLDDQGWADINSLLVGCASHGRRITRAMLEEIVSTSPKERFAFSKDGGFIRANQGHSIDVAIAYEELRPPVFLFHGTNDVALPSIRNSGLHKMQRHHVHLYEDKVAAEQVGARRGRARILRVLAKKMFEADHKFYRTSNNVWLTVHVPVEFIEFE